jgi:hypothetical protein
MAEPTILRVADHPSGADPSVDTSAFNRFADPAFAPSRVELNRIRHVEILGEAEGI